ncbi:hypothetical protein V5P93_005104 [Actinokineospora auranticolor]|uniref:hypothetical protein n=1 Tax=Actinokineospora auranticolor TaxID=155976 RepID=UPI001CA4F3FD|nr:hypothetical protein [Actinokineospora auranticolor]
MSVFKVEARLFLREPGALFWVLAFPSLLLLGFGLIPGYREAIGFAMPGIVLVALGAAGLLTLPSTPDRLPRTRRPARAADDPGPARHPTQFTAGVYVPGPPPP